MKIGILTFHDGLNHGAFLQAFSTLSFLKKTYNNVFIINYKNKNHLQKEGIFQIFNYRNPLRINDFFKKRKAFRNDQKKMSLTKFTSDIEDIKRLDLDLIIVGSDVVWNTKIFGFDKIYFGGLENFKQISYAASFGWSNAEDHLSLIREGISKFSHISVRDDNSQEIIKSLINCCPKIVLDPTFLIDWNIYENISSRAKKYKDYILIYAYYISNDEIKFIRQFAQKNNLICISIGYRQKWCKENLMNVGPFEWLSFFKGATHVVTSTYHGTIFSIIFKKSFYVSINSKIKSRVLTLFKIADIDHNYFLKTENFFYDGSNALEKLLPEINNSKQWLIEATDSIDL